MPKAEEFSVGEGRVGRVAPTGRGAWRAKAAADPQSGKHRDEAMTVRSVIAVPLRLRGRFFGVLAVANPAAAQPFSESDLTRMRSLAEQAGWPCTRRSSSLFQHEQKPLDLDPSRASGIPPILRPRVRVTPAGLDGDARHTPAQKVGGDFSDIFALAGTEPGWWSRMSPEKGFRRRG